MKNSKQELDAFMSALWRYTTRNPFFDVERIWENCAAFEIKPFDGRIRLGCIRSFTRGQGDGSRALNFLCSLADEYGVVIVGDIHPLGDKPRLNVLELRAWYRRHGFMVNGVSIERLPVGVHA